jgi:hypothetical protein
VDTQQILAQHGAPFQIEWRGRKYTLAFRTQRIKSEFIRWAKERDVRDLVAIKDLLPAEDYQEQLSRLRDEFKTDKYAIDGPEMKKLQASNDGGLAMSRIILGDAAAALSEDELLELFAARGDEIQMFVAACSGSIDQIKLDLGWDRENDPEAKKVDSKKFQAALMAADLW